MLKTVYVVDGPLRHQWVTDVPEDTTITVVPVMHNRVDPVAGTLFRPFDVGEAWYRIEETDNGPQAYFLYARGMDGEYGGPPSASPEP